MPATIAGCIKYAFARARAATDARAFAASTQDPVTRRYFKREARKHEDVVILCADQVIATRARVVRDSL